MSRQVFACASMFAALFVSGLSHAACRDAADLKRILVQRIDVEKQAIGMVIGRLDRNGTCFVAHGTRSTLDLRPIDDQTIFPVGSITKVFTSYLLADMTQRGELNLDDPVVLHLGSDLFAGDSRGSAITLSHLSWHVAGLPSLPTDFEPASLTDPYAGYTEEQLLSSLQRQKLLSAPGTEYHYSNMGAAILAAIISRTAKSSYTALVRDRVTGPRGMANTAVILSPESRKDLVQGHSWALAPVPPWTNMKVFEGAGGMHSTANDLLKLLRAATAPGPSQASNAFDLMLRHRRQGGHPPSNQVALGWELFQAAEREIYWHGGSTNNSVAFIGFDRTSLTGVVVLANAAIRARVNDIGLHLLSDGQSIATLPSGARQRSQPEVQEPSELDRLSGRYKLPHGTIVQINRKGRRLFYQDAAKTPFELHGGPGEFYLREVDARITFDLPLVGAARKLVLRVAGRETSAWRH